MSIVSAFKCSACGKLYDLFNKSRYIKHLKVHAEKRIVLRKIINLSKSSPDEINNIFSEDMSLKTFIRLSIENYNLLLRYKYHHNINQMIEYMKTEQNKINIHEKRLTRKYDLNYSDMKYVYHDNFNKREIDGTLVKDHGIGIYINDISRPIPKAFFGFKREYIRIGKFRYYIYNDFNSAMAIMVILFDPDDLVSIATAKLISE